MNTKPDATTMRAVRAAVETAGQFPPQSESYSGLRRMTTPDFARAKGQDVLSSGRPTGASTAAGISLILRTLLKRLILGHKAVFERDWVNIWGRLSWPGVHRVRGAPYEHSSILLAMLDEALALSGR